MAHSTGDYQAESEHEECCGHLEVDSDDFHLSSLNNWSNVYHTYSLIESDTSVRYLQPSAINADRFVGGFSIGGSPDQINH